MSGFSPVENRVAIAFAGIGLALLYPAWGEMHDSGAGFNSELLFGGLLATIGTAFGAGPVYDGGWDLRAWFLYLPWLVVGIVSCTVLVVGISKTSNPWWLVTFGVIVMLQGLAMLVPVIFWLIEHIQDKGLQSGEDK